MLEGSNAPICWFCATICLLQQYEYASMRGMRLERQRADARTVWYNTSTRTSAKVDFPSMSDIDHS